MSDIQNQTQPSDADMMSALFAQMVLQQSNMAMLLMGRVAHPETGKVAKDLEAAKLFIDMLEMLEVKTKGNLSKEEAGLLKQSLMTLRLAFVEAVEPPESKAAEPKVSTAETPAAAPSSAPDATAGADDDHRKKFSKKY
jgi:hypothetical protein